MYFTIKQFGIDVTGTFLNVYNKYELEPLFTKKYFNNVVVKYDTAVNKKSKTYWDTLRPVPLDPEEAKDYKIKTALTSSAKTLYGQKLTLILCAGTREKLHFQKYLLMVSGAVTNNPKKWTTFSLSHC